MESAESLRAPKTDWLQQSPRSACQECQEDAPFRPVAVRQRRVELRLQLASQEAPQSGATGEVVTITTS